MNPQPTRVIGNGSPQHLSDNPYEAAPREIDSLEDAPPPAPPPTETSPLLSSNAPRVRAKVAPKFGRRASEDPASFRTGGSRPAHTRPLLLRLSFVLACVLLYVSLSFLILSCAALTSPFIAFNALPPHYGSMFLPIWLALLSLLVNALVLLSFLFPDESPHLAYWTSHGSFLLALVSLILVVAVGPLRHRESVLTCVLLGLFLASTAHASASVPLVEKYAPLLSPPEPIETEQELRQRGAFLPSAKRVAFAILEFVSISLPLAVLHIAIFGAVVLLSLTLSIRAYDASLVPTGQLWKVDPVRRWDGTDDGWQRSGRKYGVHLSCRGTYIDGPPPVMATNTSVAVEGFKRPLVRRTVLVETDQGIPGVVGADWVMRMLWDGELTSADVEMRVCYWDRPGYGFSDNSPTSAVPHVAEALRQALSYSGELARLEPPPSLAPTPLAQSGFILVSTSYGALPSTLFASLNAPLIHSTLFLNPLPPALHFAPRPHSWLNFSFLSTLSRAFGTELGVWKIWGTLRGSTREQRVYSTEKMGQSGGIMRSLVQEEKEKGSLSSVSAKAWKKARSRYPERPTIVLSRNATNAGYERGVWMEGQERFVKEVVGKGLHRWEQDWEGSCVGAGERRCRDALLELVRID